MRKRLTEALVFLFSLFALSTVAIAQQVPLQAGSWTVGHTPAYATGGTTPIIIDSGVLANGLTFATPLSSTDTCSKGQVEFDATYIYTCIATNTWHRTSNGATW